MHLNIQNFDMMTGWTLAYAFNLFPLPADIAFDRVGQLISEPEAGAFTPENTAVWKRTMRWLQREEMVIFSHLAVQSNGGLQVGSLELTGRSFGVLRFINDTETKQPLGNALVSACEGKSQEALIRLSRTFLKHALGFD